MTGPLKNTRYEQFAQARVKGETIDAAYVTAGFSPNRSNAARLNANERIQARIAELLANAAKRTELTVANLTERLIKIADKGENLAEAPGLSVARAALMDAAKLNGLVTDRVKHDGRIEIANLSDEEIDARINALVSPDADRPTAH